MLTVVLSDISMKRDRKKDGKIERERDRYKGHRSVSVGSGGRI